MKQTCVLLAAATAALFLAVALAACSASNAQPQSAQPKGGYASLDTYPASDMSNYDCAQGYDGDYRFVDMTVSDIAAEMDAGTTFMVYAGYDHCPWCNSVLNYLNDIAVDHGIRVGYLDTRKDPSWKTNMDIDDYDLFVEKFDDVLELDDEGKKHLYVPHLFFMKDGAVVADHPGTVPSQSDSSDPLSEAQVAEYKGAVEDALAKLGA
ncbi:MAG: hypothetical protein IJ131_04185 [Eggerthellaceae bacterium]|nr:hypothetical protein [Eggerthellaceae bacterium]